MFSSKYYLHILAKILILLKIIERKIERANQITVKTYFCLRARLKKNQ